MEIRSTGTGSATGSRGTERAVSSPFPASVQAPNPQPAAPVQTADAVERAGEIPPLAQLDDAVRNINSTMSKLSQQLEFMVDPDSNRTVVKVVDQRTSEVLRQMPSKEALEIAKALDRLQGLLISEKA